MIGIISKALKIFGSTRVVLPIVVAFFSWGVYRYFLPEERGLGEVRWSLAEDVTSRIAAEIPRGDRPEETLVIPLEGDRTGEVTDLLREGLDRTGLYHVVDRDAVNRILRDLNYRERRAESLQESRTWGEKAESRFVVTGEVVELSNLPDRRRCEIAVTVIDLATTSAPFENTWTSDRGGQPFATGGTGNSIREIIVSGLVLLFFVIALPVVTSKLVQIVAAYESNAWNLVMLLGYTTSDLLFALYLVGFDLSGLWTRIGLLLVGGTAFWLNFRLCEKIDELGK